MITWRDVAAAKERSQDLIREAEKERLIRQFQVEETRPGFWQKLGRLFGRQGRAEEACSDNRPACPDLSAHQV